MGAGGAADEVAEEFKATTIATHDTVIPPIGKKLSAAAQLY
jgi:hypothetical protein